MRKFILYASMVFLLSFYAVAEIESGSEGFEISPYSTDPCAGGDVDCTYLFTASGSDKQIAMSRRPTLSGYHYHDDDDVVYHPEHDTHSDEYSSNVWYDYHLPVFTKSEVQAGYYFPQGGGNLVLVMVYSADQEGKSGATVARTSTDYGKTWTSSINLSENQHLFGLAVAPNSRYAAVRVGNKIRLRYLFDPDSSWLLKPNFAKEDHTISSRGLSLIANGSRVVVSYIGSDALSEKREFKIANGLWADVTDMPDYKKHSNDTAWLCNDTDSGFYLAARRKDSSGNKGLGVHPTDDLIVYSSFSKWNDYNADGELPISGMWKCPDRNILYILALDGGEKEIVGIESNGAKTTLYNNGSSLQRRVSMFNVPAK